MKKLVILFLAVFFGFVQLANAADCSKCSVNPTVSASATVTEEYEPNVAEVIFEIETEDKDLKKAEDINRQASEKSINALKKKLDLGDNKDLISTKGYSITPRYVTVKSGKRQLESYIVINKLYVRTKNVDKVGELISTATANGVNNVYSLNYSLENYEELANALLAKASLKSKESANAIVKPFGSQVIGVQNCSGYYNKPSSAGVANYRMAKYADAVESADLVNPVPLEAGKIKLQATVNAVYYIK